MDTHQEEEFSEELQQLLEAAFPDPDARQRWLRRPSGALGDRIPIQLIAAGREPRVIQALANLEDGVFS